MTSRSLPHLEVDDLPLVSALEELECQVTPVIWDDTSAPWDGFDLVVLRSPVDYVQRLPEFLRWAASVEGLHNPFPMVRWNADKSYFRELEQAGIPVVPTRWVRPDEPWAPEEAGRVIVKPAVGLGGEGVRRYEPHENSELTRCVEQMQKRGETALIQPYLESVEEAGEASLVFFGGTYSHAVRCTGFRQEKDEAKCLRPTSAQSSLASRVVDFLAHRFGRPLFARIDLLESRSGPVVNEVEVIDPILHFRTEPEGAQRLAAAIAEI